MTRWARSKSILKHERQPGEATTWSEFVAQRQQPAKRQQKEGATKRGDAQGSSGTLGLTDAAGKLAKDNSAVSIKKNVMSTNAAIVGTADSGEACTERTVTKLVAQALQRCFKNKALFQVKSKSVVTVDDKEAEKLEAVLKKRRIVETNVPAVQEVTDVASRGGPATVSKESMTAANAGSHRGSALSKKTVKGGSPSMKSKTQLLKMKKNACVVESALSAAEKQPSVSGENAGHDGTKEEQYPAVVLKKRKRMAAAKRTAGASATEELAPPDEKEGKMTSTPSKKTRAVKRKALSKEAAIVPMEGNPLLADGDEEQDDDDDRDGQPAPKQPRTSPHVGGGGKAERLQRLRQEREAKGMLLLPEKVERRIYLAKKAMRKKGLAGEQIKEAVRKMRRKEELLFRRQLAKLCFKCRQPGHKVSDCPQMLQDSSEAVGICFKCGSTEHFSSVCSVQTSKDNEFPFAKCFICKQQGHLSRKCPRNEKGAFPKGGHCNFCGAIDHFKRECPEMEKNKKNKGNEESEVAADIASVDQSADAENIASVGQQSHGKKAKVVSF
ncbi:uncharacterized protein LOC144125758 isoform X1 [Amblyomma americanum]